MPLLSPALPEADVPAVKWGKLYGAAAALAIAEAAATARGPLIVIAQNSRDAEGLSEEIGFFAPQDLPVRVFPDLETLPYDSFSAHPDITSARLATLSELPRARAGVWLVAVDTLLQRLPPRSYVEAYSLKIHVGESLDLEALRARLASAGYAAVTQVVAHGEFAVRGSLIDVFPMGSQSPFRIDLLDRDVDSIRQFDPDSQRSGDKLDRIQLSTAFNCCRRAKRR
jgi:transcription-repair coupling factor (superfamily II helicase)